MKNLQLSKIHEKIKIKYENYNFKHIDFTIAFNFKEGILFSCSFTTAIQGYETTNPWIFVMYSTSSIFLVCMHYLMLKYISIYLSLNYPWLYLRNLSLFRTLFPGSLQAAAVIIFLPLLNDRTKNMLKSKNINNLTLKRFSFKNIHRLSQSFYIITIFQSIVLYSNKILLRYLCTKEELDFKVKLKVNLFVLRFLRTKLSLFYQKSV